MNFKLCHTCQYEHSQICCSGCEHDNDEYVQAEWFTKKEAEIRADERKKCVKELTEAFNEHLFDSPMMNPIMTRNEILLFLERLKERKGGTK